MKFTSIVCPKCKTGAIMEEKGEYGKWYICLNCGYVARGKVLKRIKELMKLREGGETGNR